jgi:hypothetical protein
LSRVSARSTNIAYQPCFSSRNVKERLAATDRLIDQIEYKLYGLTEEEVAIVEGKT